MFFPGFHLKTQEKVHSRKASKPRNPAKRLKTLAKPIWGKLPKHKTNPASESARHGIPSPQRASPSASCWRCTCVCTRAPCWASPGPQMRRVGAGMRGHARACAGIGASGSPENPWAEMSILFFLLLVLKGRQAGFRACGWLGGNRSGKRNLGFEKQADQS